MEEGNLREEVSEAVLEGLRRSVVVGRLYSQHELVLERVRHLVTGEQNFWVPEQLPDWLNLKLLDFLII